MTKGSSNTPPVAVVTGGNAGIGRAIGMTLASSGYDVVIFDVDEGPSDIVAEVARAGRRALYLRVDVSQEDQVARAAAEARRELGPPAVLVNNAGIYPRAAALDMPYALWQQVLDVNLGGAFLCSRTLAPMMMERGGGAIVNIASGRAFQGAVRGSHYAASKAGILSLTKSLALEWAPVIRVNAVVPGVTDTAQPRQEVASDEELYARGAKYPMKRIGQPQDVAMAVDFMVSDRAAYITGESLCVNGGAIMR